jgi:hypothetical protein
MDASARNPKLDLIRSYLKKHLSACVIQAETPVDGHVPLFVAHGMTRLCAVQVSGALLSDPHLDAMELRWALKERDIAAQVRGNTVVPLTHETLRIGDLGAIGRRPKHSRAYGRMVDAAEDAQAPRLARSQHSAPSPLSEPSTRHPFRRNAST